MSASQRAAQDLALVGLIVQGDQQALRIVYDQNVRAVYAFAMRQLNEPNAAQAIANDVFLQLWQNAESFDARASLKTWLLAVCKNKAMDELRKRYRSGQYIQKIEDEQLALLEAADSQLQPDALLSSKQKGEQLAYCFATLTLEQQECINLAYVEGLKMVEIAQVLGIPIGTVGTRVHHAKSKLRICFERRTQTKVGS